MLEAVKKSLLAGLGAAVITKEKIEKVTRNLVEEGKLTTHDAEKLTNDLVDGGRKQWEEIQERISDTVKKVLEGTDLCTKKEITAISERLEYLERRVATLEKEKQAAD